MGVRLSSTAIGTLLGAAFGMLGMTIAAVWQSEMLVIPGVWAGLPRLSSSRPPWVGRQAA